LKGGESVGGKAGGVWEKLLSILLTLNIAVMGWLWTSVARLADRLDKHCEDRAIHQGINVAELVGRREFEASKESVGAAEGSLAARVSRIEEKVDTLAMRRIRDGN
jgi:hypothetical protein